MTMPAQKQAKKIPCKCGCGTLIDAVDATGQARSFAQYHYARTLRTHPEDCKCHAVCLRPYRLEAQVLMADVVECQLKQIGSCKGPLDTAHLDGDETHNVRANLRKLCRSHHRLFDLKLIDLDNPVMPAFRVRLSGPRKGERRFAATRRRERQARILRQQSVTVWQDDSGNGRHFNATAHLSASNYAATAERV